MQKALPKHNQQFAPFFSVAKKQFLDSADNLVEKHLFHCNDLKGMVRTVMDDKQEINF